MDSQKKSSTILRAHAMSNQALHRTNQNVVSSLRPIPAHDTSGPCVSNFTADQYQEQENDRNPTAREDVYVAQMPSEMQRPALSVARLQRQGAHDEAGASCLEGREHAGQVKPLADRVTKLQSYAASPSKDGSHGLRARTTTLSWDSTSGSTWHTGSLSNVSRS